MIKLLKCGKIDYNTNKYSLKEYLSVSTTRHLLLFILYNYATEIKKNRSKFISVPYLKKLSSLKYTIIKVLVQQFIYFLYVSKL